MAAHRAGGLPVSCHAELFIGVILSMLGASLVFTFAYGAYLGVMKLQLDIIK
jgi:hypothetical protein